MKIIFKLKHKIDVTKQRRIIWWDFTAFHREEREYLCSANEIETLFFSLLSCRSAGSASNSVNNRCYAKVSSISQKVYFLFVSLFSILSWSTLLACCLVFMFRSGWKHFRYFSDEILAFFYLNLTIIRRKKGKKPSENLTVSNEKSIAHFIILLKLSSSFGIGIEVFCSHLFVRLHCDKPTSSSSLSMSFVYEREKDFFLPCLLASISTFDQENSSCWYKNASQRWMRSDSDIKMRSFDATAARTKNQEWGRWRRMHRHKRTVNMKFMRENIEKKKFFSISVEKVIISIEIQLIKIICFQ